MWKINKTISALLVILHLTACTPAIVVDLAVTPASKASATIKSLTQQENPNPQSCDLPCKLKIDRNTKYEVSVTSDGYYPAVITLDHTAALFTSSALKPREHQVPLIIPLIKNEITQPIMGQ